MPASATTTKETTIRAMMPANATTTKETTALIALASLNDSTVNATNAALSVGDIQPIGIWAYMQAKLMMFLDQLWTIIQNAIVASLSSGPSMVTMVNIAIATVQGTCDVALVAAVQQTIPKKELFDLLATVKDGK